MEGRITGPTLHLVNRLLASRLVPILRLRSAPAQAPIEMDRSAGVFECQRTNLSKSLPPCGVTDLAAALPSLIPFLAASSAFAYRHPTSGRATTLPHFVGEDT
jgi:hypothetical protein